MNFTKATSLLLIAGLVISNLQASKARTREENIDIIIQSQGLKEMWAKEYEAEIQEIKDKSKQSDEAYLKNQLRINPNISRDCLSPKITELENSYFSNSVSKFLISPEESVAIWKKYYGASLTDQDLDELASFYTSELAKKEAESNKAALIKFKEEYSLVKDKKLEAKSTEVIDFIDKLDEATEACIPKRAEEK